MAVNLLTASTVFKVQKSGHRCSICIHTNKFEKIHHTVTAANNGEQFFSQLDISANISMKRSLHFNSILCCKMPLQRQVQLLVPKCITLLSTVGPLLKDHPICLKATLFALYEV